MCAGQRCAVSGRRPSRCFSRRPARRDGDVTPCRTARKTTPAPILLKPPSAGFNRMVWLNGNYGRLMGAVRTSSRMPKRLSSLMGQGFLRIGVQWRLGMPFRHCPHRNSPTTIHVQPTRAFRHPHNQNMLKNLPQAVFPAWSAKFGPLASHPIRHTPARSPAKASTVAQKPCRPTNVRRI